MHKTNGRGEYIVQKLCEACSQYEKNNKEIFKAISDLIAAGKLPPTAYTDLKDQLCTNAGC